jgi:ribosomal protein L31
MTLLSREVVEQPVIHSHQKAIVPSTTCGDVYTQRSTSEKSMIPVVMCSGQCTPFLYSACSNL